MVKMTQRSKAASNRGGAGADKDKSSASIDQGKARDDESTGEPAFEAKAHFQNHLSLTLFNLSVYVVFNDVMGVATFAS